MRFLLFLPVFFYAISTHVIPRNHPDRKLDRSYHPMFRRELDSTGNREEVDKEQFQAKENKAQADPADTGINLNQTLHSPFTDISISQNIPWNKLPQKFWNLDIETFPVPTKSPLKTYPNRYFLLSAPAEGSGHVMNLEVVNLQEEEPAGDSETYSSREIVFPSRKHKRTKKESDDEDSTDASDDEDSTNDSEDEDSLKVINVEEVEGSTKKIHPTKTMVSGKEAVNTKSYSILRTKIERPPKKKKKKKLLMLQEQGLDSAEGSNDEDSTTDYEDEDFSKGIIFAEEKGSTKNVQMHETKTVLGGKQAVNTLSYSILGTKIERAAKKKKKKKKEKLLELMLEEQGQDSREGSDDEDSTDASDDEDSTTDSEDEDSLKAINVEEVEGSTKKIHPTKTVVSGKESVNTKSYSILKTKIERPPKKKHKKKQQLELMLEEQGPDNTDRSDNEDFITDSEDEDSSEEIIAAEVKGSTKKIKVTKKSKVSKVVKGPKKKKRRKKKKKGELNLSELAAKDLFESKNEAESSQNRLLPPQGKLVPENASNSGNSASPEIKNGNVQEGKDKNKTANETVGFSAESSLPVESPANKNNNVKDSANASGSAGSFPDAKSRDGKSGKEDGTPVKDLDKIPKQSPQHQPASVKNDGKVDSEQKAVQQPGKWPNLTQEIFPQKAPEIGKSEAEIKQQDYSTTKELNASLQHGMQIDGPSINFPQLQAAPSNNKLQEGKGQHSAALSG